MSVHKVPGLVGPLDDSLDPCENIYIYIYNHLNGLTVAVFIMYLVFLS